MRSENQLGERRVSARQGREGEKKDFINSLAGGMNCADL
jgi:hypothetical protein